MLVEKTKEIMYHKWDRALLADLLWTCGKLADISQLVGNRVKTVFASGKHVLFCNIFCLFFVYIVHGHKS